MAKIFPKLGSKVCQLLNESLNDYQRYLKLCKIGEISPNLATLDQTFMPKLVVPIHLVKIC